MKWFAQLPRNEPGFQSLKLGSIWSEGRGSKWEIWGWIHWFSPSDIVSCVLGEGRIRDWEEVHQETKEEGVREQAPKNC